MERKVHREEAKSKANGALRGESKSSELLGWAKWSYFSLLQTREEEEKEEDMKRSVLKDKKMEKKKHENRHFCQLIPCKNSCGAKSPL